MRPKKKTLNSVDQMFGKLQHFKDKADMLAILGTGWNHVLDAMQIMKEMTFEEVFGAQAGVAGHLGKLVLGRLKKRSVWVMAGRLHTYEGYSSNEVTRPLQALAKIGVKELIVTSAAGGLNSDYKVGDIVVLSDLITLLCESPLVRGANFQDLSEPFDVKLRARAIASCEKHVLSHQKTGVYMYTKGPHFETKADKKMLMGLGADCVGMSTVPETIMAKHLGIRTLGLSCITNLAFVKHSHHEVVASAEAVSGNMVKILTGVIA